MSDPAPPADDRTPAGYDPDGTPYYPPTVGQLGLCGPRSDDPGVGPDAARHTPPADDQAARPRMSAEQYALLRRWATDGFDFRRGDPDLTFADMLSEIERLQDAATDAVVRQVNLKGMTVEQGATLLELDSPRELVIPWVWAARELLGDAPNYSETRIDFPAASASMEVKAAGERERFVLTVQRAGKVTPPEARKAAEAKVAAVRALAEKRREIVSSPYGDIEVGGLHVAEVRAALGEDPETVGLEVTVRAALERQRADIVAWLRSEVEGWLPGGGDHRRGWVDAYTQAADDLEANGPSGPPPAPLPRRDDHVAVWIKAARDRQNPDGTPWDLGRWNVLDDLLEDYRLHADTGTPLDEHTCDGGNCDTCREAGEQAGNPS